MNMAESEMIRKMTVDGNQKEKSRVKEMEQMVLMEKLLEILLPSAWRLENKLSEKEENRIERWQKYNISQEDAYRLCREAPGEFRSREEEIKFLYVNNDGEIRRDPNTDYFPYITRSDSICLDLHEIILIKYSLTHIIILTVNHEEYRMKGKMEDYFRFLSTDFCHAYKDTIVNFANIRRMNKVTVLFKNGYKITMGAQYFNMLHRKFKKYLKRGYKNSLHS
jgi:DNA-binding LytR/AlgR family response regulator